jgi:uncharacterized membrane protein YkgB
MRAGRRRSTRRALKRISLRDDAHALGALGSVLTFICTVTIIPFMPDGWAASAGGFPAMVGNVAFLMKDVVLLAVSVYLLRQDVLRLVSAAPVDNFTGASTIAQVRV